MEIRSGSIAMPRSLDGLGIEEKIAQLSQASGKSVPSLALVHQIHSNQVISVMHAPVGDGVAGTGDAMITNVPGIALVIRTADCVPVLFADASKGVVAIAHAGWKGVLSGVIERVLESMVHEFGCEMGAIRVTLGPAICGRHYDVSTVPDDRVAQFENQFSPEDGVIVREHAAVRLDLPQACLVQCRRFGVPSESIQLPEACTYENVHWPSHRREGERRQNHVWSWVCLSKP